MTDKYIFVHKGNSTVNFYLHLHSPEAEVELGFEGYSIKHAIQKIRREYGLKYKKIIIIDNRKVDSIYDSTLPF